MKISKKIESFGERLLKLISEPDFIKIENILSEPNFFKIVGRAHYERWHSAFWGWLIDPNGSHLVGDYVFKRILLLLLDESTLKSSNENRDFLLNVLPVAEFSDLEVTPNEDSSTERSVMGVGRFDIYCTGDFKDEFENTGRVNIIFELKIESKPNHSQSQRYADWLALQHPNDINFLIYLIPNLEKDSKWMVGDNRWFCLSYQILNDKLLFPLLDHPRLNEKVKPFIIQYIKNLKHRNRGIKMAITNEERKIARALYEKYSDVFDSIYDVLVSESIIDFSTSDITNNTKGRETGRLAVKINGKVFSNNTLRLLFSDVLKYLVDKNYIEKIP